MYFREKNSWIFSLTFSTGSGELTPIIELPCLWDGRIEVPSRRTPVQPAHAPGRHGGSQDRLHSLQVGPNNWSQSSLDNEHGRPIPERQQHRRAEAATGAGDLTSSRIFFAICDLSFQ